MEVYVRTIGPCYRLLNVEASCFPFVSELLTYRFLRTNLWPEAPPGCHGYLNGDVDLLTRLAPDVKSFPRSFLTV